MPPPKSDTNHQTKNLVYSCNMMVSQVNYIAFIFIELQNKFFCKLATLMSNYE